MTRMRDGGLSMFNKIHHAAIIVSDYERSKKFYVEKLGLEIVDENFRSERNSYKLDLQVGENRLELFSFPHPPQRVDAPEAAGLRHLCFEVDDLLTVVEKLTYHGIQVEKIRRDPYTGCRYTFFKDPDGLPIELYEKE